MATPCLQYQLTFLVLVLTVAKCKAQMLSLPPSALLHMADAESRRRWQLLEVSLAGLGLSWAVSTLARRVLHLQRHQVLGHLVGIVVVACTVSGSQLTLPPATQQWHTG